MATEKSPEGWSFTTKEVSATVYEVRADAPDGLIMLRRGTDDVAVLSKLIKDAWKLSQ